MANTPIASSAVTIELLKHAAWTPEDEDGTADLRRRTIGDAQEFATVEGAGFMIDGDSGIEEPAVKASSIVSSAANSTSASKYRTSPARTITWISPATFNAWVQKFFETVVGDATRRPADADRDLCHRQQQLDRIPRDEAGEHVRGRPVS